MSEEDFHRGVFFTLLSAIGLALLGLLGKIGGAYLPLSSLIFWRFFTGFLFFLALLLVLGKFKKGWHTQHWKSNSIRAFFMLASQGLFYAYLQQGTLLNGLVLLNTGPIFIPIIEWAILRKFVGKSSWVGVAVAFVGVLFVLQPDTALFQMSSWMGLCAGLSQAISQILFGLSSKKENLLMGLLLLFFFLALFSFCPYALLGFPNLEGEMVSSWTLILVFLLGSISVLNQLARSEAYQRSSPAKLSAFLYFSVPLAALFDWWIFDNVPNAFAVIGTILVVSGGLLKIYLRKAILSRKK